MLYRLTAVVAALLTSVAAAAPLSNWPLVFEENTGQFSSDIRFLARGSGYTVALGERPIIEFQRGHALGADRAVVELEIIDANEDATPTGDLISPSRVHTLGGAERRSRAHGGSFSRIRQADVLPGVDLVYYGRDGRFEFDFEIAPGVDPASIRFRFSGSQSVAVSEDNRLEIAVGGAIIAQAPPVAYVLDGDRRDPVAVNYVVEDRTIGFELGAYDRKKPLVIDPIIEYSAYFGGAGRDRAEDLHVDAAGNLYLLATTTTSALASPGAFQESAPQRTVSESFPTCADCPDAIDGPQVRRVSVSESSSVLIAKFDPTATSLLWATYFSAPDGGFLRPGFNSSAVSPGGEIAFGLNNRAPAGLPEINSTQLYDPFQANVYVAGLNAAGDALVFATYLHVGDGFFLRGLDVAPDGSIAAVGGLADFGSRNFIVDFPEINPIAGQSCALAGFDNGASDFYDGFIIEFAASGTSTFASCLGGSQRAPEGGGSAEALRDVAYGPDGDIYVLGYSSMVDFPTVNALQTAPGVPGYRDATITRIDPDTSTIVQATFFGATAPGTVPGPGSAFNNHFPHNIAVPAAGRVVVSGTTNETRFPTVNAFQPNFNYPQATFTGFTPNSFIAPDTDMYVASIDLATGVIFSTYLGGTGGEHGFQDMALDGAGNIYVYSLTDSADYPQVNAVQTPPSGQTYHALTKLTPEGRLAFSSLLGAGDPGLVQIPGGIVVNDNDDVILFGNTQSDSFPTVNSGTTLNGRHDITISILDQSVDSDADGDGVPDAADAFPADGGEWRDSDDNGTGDVTDTDDDGDGVEDAMDRFPLAAAESMDTDNDGIGDNADAFPADASNFSDFDDDGIADFNDPDIDGDRMPNTFESDHFVFDADEYRDTDGDGVGDNVDADDDGDGVDDSADPGPLDFRNPVDTFAGFSAFNTSLFKSGLPEGFATLDAAVTAWTSASDSADPNFDDRSSLTSLNPGDGNQSAVEYTGIFAGGIAGFAYRVDSEADADFFRVRLDGSEILAASGTVPWTDFTFPVAAGEHTLVFSYDKNGANADGADAAWIDSLANFPIPPQDVSVEVLAKPGGAGESAAYTVTISNRGTRNVRGITFDLQIDPDLIDPTWTCVPVAVGGDCTRRAGAGSTRQAVELFASGKLEVTISGIVPTPLAAPIEMAASVMAPAGLVDPDLSNNRFGSFSVPTAPLPPATDQQAGDQLGAAVATSGNFIAVGSPGAAGGGRVVIYRANGDDFVEEAVITVAGTTNFGDAVALDGGRLLVGAPPEPGGAVKVAALQAALFERVNGVWTQKQTFSADNGQADDEFGDSVALDGDLVLIGAPGDAEGETGGSGAAHVYRLGADASVVQSRKIKPLITNAGARFGAAVALSSGGLAIGSPGTFLDNIATGAVSLYDQIAQNLDNLRSRGTVAGSNSRSGDQFGSSVAMSGDTVLVGAPGEDSAGADSGAAYVLDLGGSQVTELTRLVPSSAGSNARFGSAVAISSNAIAVGAPGSASGAGAVFGFNGAFQPTTVVQARVGQMGLGTAVAAGGSTAVFGAPTTNGDTGGALVQRNPVLLSTGFESSMP